MFSVQQIKLVNLEITTRCQAACPFCPRNYNGYGVREGFPVQDMSFNEFTHLFDPFLGNDDLKIQLCGTYGDPAMSNTLVPIIDYCSYNYPDVVITMSSNASLRTPKWWAALAAYKNLKIEFALDGLKDTHHIYRQNTNWDKVIENATAYINAGGHAIWQFIEFEHNKHQKQDCEKMSQELGFKSFKPFEDGRNDGPAYTPSGEPFWIGADPESIPDIETFLATEKELHSKYTQNQQLEYPEKDYTDINCKSIDYGMINVSVDSQVWPCCWLGGTFPLTFDTDRGHELKEIIPHLKLDGKTHTMEEILNSFAAISDRFNTNPLQICGERCGKRI